MKKRILLLLSFSLLFFSLSTAQITSTFDTDADGWIFLNSATPITPNHSTTGGNPTGFISVAYSASVGTSTQSWIAPAKFLGSQVLRSMDMNLLFDLQQSQAGTSSNVNGDVRIESGSTIIVYSLPTKPAVAPLWSSYSLKLDETQGWRVGSTTGPFATRTQIIAILSNITAIEIRGTYATNAAYTSGIDNVILEQRTLSPSPTIASFTPTSGEPGTALTIIGTNFDTTPTNNAVYFGSIAGTITSASATQLSVTIPIGALSGPITVINKTTGTSKRSEKPFNPTFTEGGRIIPASLKPRFDILLGTTPGNDLNGLVAADLDGDGWNDLLVTESLPATVSIFRNLGSGGNLSAASFAPKILLASSGAGNGLFTFDLDGDGKLDVVSTNASSFTTYRNTSTPGNLSFEPVELWPNPIVGITSDVVDVDGDGHLDLIGQHYNGSVAGDFWIALNISSPGNIEFGASITYFGGSLLDAGSGVTSGDLDNDGKPDLIVRHWFGGNFSIIKNNSTPGNISLDTPIRFTIGSYGNINIADFNGDGKNDIAWKDGSGNNDIRIRINTNSGGALAATDFATEVILDSELTNYGGMSVADVNGDGKPDIIAADAADVGVFENNYSGGAFDANAFVSAYQLQGYSAATYPFSPVVADLNGDKKPELILGYTNSSPTRISIFENKNVPAPVISLNTVSPLSAPVGSTVTITGNNFSTNTTDNEVWFGDVRATVLTASATQLTVTVPAGAAYAPVSVRKGELSSSYHLPFSTSFSSGVTFNATHFAPPITYTLAGADYDIEVGDLDLDGKPDVIADGTGQIPRLFQNTHASGAISGTSLTTAGAVANSAANAKLVDVDGDGKLDIVGGSGRTFPNQSTVGSILFGTEINAISGDNVTFGDLNQDGKTDLASAAFSSGSAQLILQENRSNVGTFVSSGAFGTFSTSIVYTKASRGGDVTIADFDNDGFNDVVSLNPFTDNMSIFRNSQKYRVSTTMFDPRVEIAVGDNPLRSYPADFDKDGKIDLLVTHWTGTSTTLLIVFHNTSTVGTISFNRIDITNPSTVTIATVADLDGDSKPEILTTSESGNRFSIFKNVHTTGALSTASFAAPFNTTVTAPRGIATGDLNLDGKPEIILTRAAGLLLVYENLVTSIPIVPPTITSFTPTSAPAGSSITITGTDFDALATNNIVYFGTVKAVVTAATSTQLTVTVPSGAGYGRINVLNKTNGRASLSPKAFTPTFDGGGRIIPASFKPKFDIPTILIESVSAADVDGDGWIDLAVTNDFTDRVIDIYPNLGAGGTLSPASFATKVSIGYSGVSSNGSGLWFSDLDGDGKLDAITSAATVGFVGVFVTFRNTSTPGSISFEAPEYWQGASDESPIAYIGDLDGDGRPEMVSGEGAIPGGFWFNQNLSTPGNIEFGSWVAPFPLAVINGFSGATAADLNGDGKPELIVSNGQGQAIDVLQNVSTPGAPAFTAAFQFSTNQYTYNSMVVTDMNLDGKNDLLYKVSGEVGFHIRLNTDTDGTLTAADFAADLIFTGDLSGGIQYSAGISIADMNGDGKPDIVANDNTDFGVFENVFSGGVFDLNSLVPAYQYEAPGINTAPTPPIAVDLNGDGRPEIFAGITNAGTPDKFTIYENVNSSAPLISVNTVSPLSGPVGSTVTITGSNFSTVTTENMVWFGSVKATVLTATATEITVTVPPGAGYAAVSVTKNELTSKYHLPFQTTFSSGVTLNNTHFAAPVEFTLAGADYDLDIGDLDNDGRPDIVAEGGTAATTRFRNTHTSASITTASLTDNGVSAGIRFPRLQDLDGDGKLDLIGVNTLSKNSSTTGNISFLANVPLSGVDGFGIADFGDVNRDGKTDVLVVEQSLAANVVENQSAKLVGNFTTGTFASFVRSFVTRATSRGSLVVVDFDNDGYTDMITTNPTLDNVSIYKNAKRPRANATSFEASVELSVGDNPQRIYTSDFDRDGKLDVLVLHGAGTTSTLLTIFQNTSTVGSISFNRIDLTNPSATTVATVADLDGDGKPEIITTSESGNRFSILKNIHASGSLTAASFAAPFNTTVTAPRGITTGDLNLDGKPEIILTRAAGLLVVYENLIPSIPPPTITSFTPTSGPIGITVTINGINFDTTPSNNTVQFNGTIAVVTASTATSITTSVPSGATTGTITVTVAGNTATSATNFTVTASPVITITTQPSDFIACVGQTATFTTEATGTTNIVYQWQFSPDGIVPYTDIANGGGFANASTATLSVNTTGNFGAGFYRAKINGDLASTIFSDAVQLTVNVTPASPIIANASRCGAGTVVLTASGGVDGNYRWYENSTGSSSIIGQTASTFTTPVLTVNTTYYVSLVNGACETTLVPVVATINSIPAQPLIQFTGNSDFCIGETLTLNAPLAAAYLWSTGATTQSIDVSTAGSFTVSITDTNGCTSVLSQPVVTTLRNCNNQPPAIDTTPLSTQVGSTLTFNLLSLLTDPDGNLDLSTLQIIAQPESGAIATIENGNLQINYANITFTGTDRLILQVCDLEGSCTQQTLEIEVIGDVEIFNAVSPNGDGLNDVFIIQFINSIPETVSNKVTIYNRWGDEVFSIADYDNDQKVFKGLTNSGKELPTGTYFYKIEFNSGRSGKNGYLYLKR